ncbi:MAG TPA: DUF3999 family protein [Acidobacteriaceae bacterium]|jgi:hypothetical protein|nr:DUF3999 family protein [Acidobacteriaceae bacterium]
MKMRAALVLLALAAATPQIRYFRYDRAVSAPASHAGQTCVALDAALFAHAASGLNDLRLYRAANGGDAETPYAIREETAAQPSQRSIAPLDLGRKGQQTTFEAAMPEGRYSDVDLDIDAKNFVAQVAVTGAQSTDGREGSELGLYTIFDLTGQKLGRSMVLHLPQSDFRYLYFAIRGPVKPEDVHGISVDRVPAKIQYVTVSSTDQVAQKGHTTVATLQAPARVPVDRVEFVPGAQPQNFSRDVTLTVTRTATGATREDELPATLSSSGNLLRVHGVHDGRQIDEEQLAVDAPYMVIGTAARWTVTIDNGDDAPLDLKAVRLEMAERKLCFDAAAGASYTLFYGDAALSAPRYDYATLFTPDKDAAQATLAPEQPNPLYAARPDTRPFTEKYPWLLWGTLVAVVLLLGAVALRTAKETSPPR